MRRMHMGLGALWVVAVSAAVVVAGQPKDKQTFTDAREAGPDFQIQGEYEGKTAAGDQLGAQVIALGDGRFDAVLFPGGLPGAGSDGKTKFKLAGKTAGDVTKLTGNEAAGEIRAGTFSGQLKGAAFELKKVERTSPTLGAQPPRGAIVLFDGTNVEAWQNGRLQEGTLLAVGTRTRQKFKDFTLHLEFRTPFMPFARGQARGNSGMYLLDQYEVQILDSFGLEGKSNECGGIYSVAEPRINMCLPPLSWQTYDVEFKAARFDDSGNKTADAVVTIRHNGVVIHEDLKLKATPGGGQNDERPGALYLQDHGNPVHFRNIWVVER